MRLNSLARSLVFLQLFLFGVSLTAAPVISNSNWKYLKALNEASVPTEAWRFPGFNDGPWPSDPAPFYYGEALTGTLLSDMQGGYTSVYFRYAFNVSNSLEVAALTFTATSDDGFIAWVNGTEVARYNMPAGPVAYNGAAAAALEPVETTYTLTNQGGLLQNGTNVLAVHAFNASLAGSSDFVFFASLNSIIMETFPPTVASFDPPAGARTNLTQISVTFSEPVQGVNGTDLLVSGNPAASVSGGGASYVFNFLQPAFGTVNVGWSPSHGIADLAFPPNPFDGNGVGATWQYQLTDVSAPVVSSLSPSAGSTVGSLGQIDVVFNEGVAGVDASDLLIEGIAATNVVVVSPAFYLFQFTPPSTGTVTVAWSGGHGITDLAAVPNAFAGGTWNYRFDPAAASNVVLISEFMANNDSTLADRDGEFSDWIEILNAGNTSVQLLNWALTDEKGNLTKWLFPATNLAPGEFMVIFASEKDRREPGGELHTNFRLANGGEYLALARPDGTIASEFDPFASQVRNVSHGFGFDVSSFTLIQSNVPVRVLVPTSGVLADTWKDQTFDAGSWLAATNGVGYDTGFSDPGENSYDASIAQTTPVAYWRFSEVSGTSAANQGTGGAAQNGTFQGGVTLGQPGPRPPTFAGFDAPNTAPRFSGSSQYMSSSSGLLSGRSSFTISGWVNPAATPGNRIGLFGQNDAVEFGFINPTEIQCWTPSGGSVNVTHGMAINTWYHVLAVGDGTSIRVYIDGTLRGTGGSATGNYGASADTFNVGGGGIFDTIGVNGNYFNGLVDEVAVYQRALTLTEIALLYNAGLNAPNTPLNDLIATDIGSAMRNINSTAYIRLPFQVADPSIVDRMTLQVRYDDGFFAFLNGHLVASANAPVTNLWNSASTTQHPDVAARQYQEFVLSGASPLLTPGENILAIQGLNFSATNNDFLIQVQLGGISVGALGTSPRYFTLPTPNGPNGTGVNDLGPIITDVSHFPEIPGNNDDLYVTARVAPAFSPVSGVTLRWQVMYGSLNTLTMFDDGLHGDGLAGDRVFGAIIPASASTNGQMIRWYVTSVDGNGNNSRWPLFLELLDSQEFLGTVVTDPSINSHLMVMQRFIQNPAAAETTTGTRCSIFHLGEFYDNVEINLHGQSSAGFPKKSADMDFPNDHRFRYKEGESRVKDIKLITNWGDKARVRNSLGWEFIERAGSAGHFSYQIRIQQNGAFHSIADMIEDPDDLWMERVGRDGNGALYKIYNSLDSAGGAEKKTRKHEGNADLQALVNSLNPSLALTSRVAYAYDNVDLPQTISYFVASALISHQDHGHKNNYVYRDSDGSGEWSLIPWDIDLDWGRNWIDSGGYFTDTMYTDNVLDFYNTAQQGKGRNRFYDLIYTNNAFRAMYLRRLRTVMDTVLQAPGTPAADLIIERRIREMLDLMDPPSIGVSDADLDFTRWGTWGNNNAMRAEAQRIIDLHLPARRTWLFTNPAAQLNGERIPGLQPENIAIKIAAIEYNPASGNQAQEFIRLTNGNPFAVDISGWSVAGGVEFTFRPGTVIPSNSVLYLSPDVVAFRARTTGPRGGQSLFVQGPYLGQLSARGEPLMVRDTFGRTVNSTNYIGAPSLAQQFLRVTEIMYNPAALAGNTNNPENFEYIELKNISGVQTLSLTGIKFVNGIDFNFSTGAVTSLAPGQSVLVVRNQAAFVARYGAGLLIAGQYEGNLDSNGERVRLLDSANEEILDFDYNDAWYRITDGLGFSLVVVDQNALPELWSTSTQWRPSGLVDGSPTQQDPAPPSIAPIVVNEALTRSEIPPPTDTIELYNPTGQAVSLTDWYLSDDFATPKKYRIPSGVTVSGNGYVTFDESNFNVGGEGFALSSNNDELYLFSGNAAGQLTGYYHGFSFGAADDGVSFGRHVISTGEAHFVAQTSRTLGTVNAPVKVGPIVIAEIMYHPEEILGEDNSLHEFIELRNITGLPVALYESGLPTNVWQLTDAVDFDFPTNFSIPAFGRVLVVNFNPASSPAALADFQAVYGVGGGVTYMGPYGGKLDNSGGSVELKKPTLIPGGIVALVLVDKVEYRDSIPWPAGADGFGLSLQRINDGAYGNDPSNWRSAPPTAAQPLPEGGIAPALTMQPTNQTVLGGMDATLISAATGSSQLLYQWRFNGEDIAGATSSTLQINRVALRNRGAYEVIAYNAYGSAVSQEAFLDVQLAASIIQHPQSAAVVPGTNLTLTVQAFSPSPITFQWRKNGVPINGATTTSLLLANIDINHVGAYDVVVTDGVGAVVSDVANIRVLIRPVITVQPIAHTNALVGSSVTLSVQVTNTATLPVTYRWRKDNTVFLARTINSRSDFITLTNLQFTDTANYRVGITNEAFTTPGFLSVAARVTVVANADMDGDGMPDSYEMANGLNKNNAADANSDLDGDGVSNKDEYNSGTDPQSDSSYLHFESITATGDVGIRFLAVENKSYSVLYRDQSDSGPWQVLASVHALSATGTATRTVEVTDSTQPLSLERYYRLVTPAMSAP